MKRIQLGSPGIEIEKNGFGALPIQRISKQDAAYYTKVFVLFGDPALRLAYPKNNVVLKKINGKPVFSRLPVFCACKIFIS